MEGVDDFAELGEDEDSFLTVGEFRAEFGEAGEFSAIGGSIDAVAAPVAGVIADLFEPHEVADDEAAALHGADGFVDEVAFELFDQLSIEDSLLAAEAAGGGDFCFVRQIGDDGFVRLHAPQNIGLDEAAQGGVASRGLSQPFEVTGKGGGSAEQARVEEIEEGPEVARAVFDRSAGEGEPPWSSEFLDGFGLDGAGVFDGLGFIENDGGPGVFLQSGAALEQSVSGQDGVISRKHFVSLGKGGGELVPRCPGRMGGEDAEVGSEFFEFGLPVSNQAGGDNQQRGGI